MLDRYHIIRGKRPSGDPLPEGIRQDTRMHTHHLLHPPKELVEAFLEDPEDRWEDFRRGYLAVLEERLADDRAPFETLAEHARRHDVHLGCNCPTHKQPDVMRCHTVLALRFMKKHFPDLEVELPREHRA